MINTFRLILLSLLQYTLLFSHGFDASVVVHLADDSYVKIDQLCRNALRKNIEVLTYDTHHGITNQTILQRGRSSTKRLIRFAFGNNKDYVTCTPLQEFLLALENQWIPAYKLQNGDMLLCKNGPQKIKTIEYVKQEANVYIIELPLPHTFFVGKTDLITHNIALPIIWSVGASISFGTTTGLSAGSLFGPVTFAVGAAIGSLLGACIGIAQNSRIPKYSWYNGNINFFDEYTHNNAPTNTDNSSYNGGVSPEPDDPKKNENDNNKIKISEKDKHHIFRKSRGHFPKDTPEARKILEEMTNDKNNYNGTNMHGVDIYLKELPDKTQIWSQVRSGKITNAGVNNIDTVAKFDPAIPSGIKVLR